MQYENRGISVDYTIRVTINDGFSNHERDYKTNGQISVQEIERLIGKYIDKHAPASAPNENRATKEYPNLVVQLVERIEALEKWRDSMEMEQDDNI